LTGASFPSPSWIVRRPLSRTSRATCASATHEIKLVGGFSPIHLLSIYVLFGSWQAIAAARRHDIAAHHRHVAGMYLGGIVVAGPFTMLPGRLMHASLFSGLSNWQAGATAAVLATLQVAATGLAIRQGRLFGHGKSSKRLA
jgi:hypothetical protein